MTTDCCSQHPRAKRTVLLYVLQPLVLMAVVAVVVLPTVYVFRKYRAELEASKSRISCLGPAVNEVSCRAAGCLWYPIEGGAPSCYFPPVDQHGYRVLDTRYSEAGHVQLRLGLLKTSATPAPDAKEELLLDVTEYSEDMFRVRVTVPGESRYEVPVPLQLPSESSSAALRFRLSYTPSNTSDLFVLRVTRADTGTVLFDTSLGGLTYASQFLQVSTTLPSAHVYGLGEHAHPTLRHSFNTHSTWPMFSRDQPPLLGDAINLYGSHPVYYVVEEDGNGHAVIWLNSNAMEAEILPSRGLALRAVGGVMDLFFLLGPRPTQVIQQYTRLVGVPALPPYWGLGFHLSRYGYSNTEDMKEAVWRTRRHGVPQDVQYGDIDIMDRRLSFTVDPDNFGDLPEYVGELQAEGVHFVTILDPAINAELSAEAYPVHQRASAMDVYVKWPSDQVPEGGNYGQGDVMLGYVWPDNRTAFPDFMRSSTADWYRAEVEEYHGTLPFDGLWIDMNEPANFGTNEDAPWNWGDSEPWSLHCPTSVWDDPPYTTAAAPSKKRLSDKTLCMSGMQGDERQYRHYDVHSLYGWAQAGPTLSALRNTTGRRGIVISRSTFPSSGRWAGHWLGDNSAIWMHLKSSIVGILEFNLFGIPYVGADICGFFLDTTEELCARWMQLGAFYPYSRNHNDRGAIPQDPGRWPRVASVGRRALRLRYSLLPLLYTLHWRASTLGEAVLLPLAFQFPKDVAARGIDTQFLWGASLMVAPVLTEGATEREVYFPEAGRWYSYYGGNVVARTPGSITVAAPLDGDVPLFVNGGSILPTQRPAANTRLSRLNPLGLVVAPTGAGLAEGELYWDDGEAIDPGSTEEYYTASITYNQSARLISWQVSHPHAASSGGVVLSDVRVFGVAGRPYQVLLNGASITRGDWHYDAVNEVLELYDLKVSVDQDFFLSWTTSTADLLLPCPVSYNGVLGSPLPLLEGECVQRGCRWDDAAEVQCSLPALSSLGYTVAGDRSHSSNGYSLPLQRKPANGFLFGDPINEVTFEVTYLGDDVLRIKLYDALKSRYEVPLATSAPLPGTGNPRYEVLLTDTVGDDFSFAVMRTDTKTALFDTRVGGMVLEEQFLSISALLPSRNVYGLGENTHSSFRHSFDGTVWSIFARDQPPVVDSDVNLYGAHPYYECVENDGTSHGVLLLNSNAMDYQLLNYPSVTFRTIGGVLDLYFFLGPSPEEVTAQYTALIGRPVIPPYWALGFQLSRYGYRDLQHMQEALNRTLALQVPIDVQYADIDHMDRRKVFTIDEDHFGGLPEYVEELHGAGMRFIVILDPAINAELPAAEYAPHARALASDVYIKWPADTDQDVLDENNGGQSSIMLGFVWPDNRTAFPNWHLPATHDWWGEEVVTFHNKLAFDGIWIDMNEPAVFDTNMKQPWNWPEWQNGSWNLVCPTTKWDDPPYVTKAASLGPSYRMSDKTLCLSADVTPYLHYDVHNLYGWAQTEPTLKAVRTATGQRGVVITRSTFVGSGRWAGHWLGDNWSIWTDLHRSIIGMLEFNLFGIPYIGADICGFFGNATEELCGRWMQLGAFYPFSRNHNGIGQLDQDPGMWPETVAVWARDALNVRYTLLPYLYTLFFRAATEGATVVRPMHHEFSSDRACLTIDDQFLWGAHLMVAPVLLPKTTQRRVYFPHDAWYDYYTGAPVEWPGETVMVDAPLTTIPLFVRGGAVIPTQEPATNTHLSSQQPMGALVALGLNRRALGWLFWDDLQGVDTVANTRYSLLLYSFVEDTLTMTVEANHNEDLGPLKLRDFVFFGVEREPTAVLVNGARLRGTATYEGTTRRLSVVLQPLLQLNQGMTIILQGIWQ